MTDRIQQPKFTFTLCDEATQLYHFEIRCLRGNNYRKRGKINTSTVQSQIAPLTKGTAKYSKSTLFTLFYIKKNFFYYFYRKRKKEEKLYWREKGIPNKQTRIIIIRAPKGCSSTQGCIKINRSRYRILRFGEGNRGVREWENFRTLGIRKEKNRENTVTGGEYRTTPIHSFV